jgi:hypothetical protein
MLKSLKMSWIFIIKILNLGHIFSKEMNHKKISINPASPNYFKKYLRKIKKLIKKLFSKKKFPDS